MSRSTLFLVLAAFCWGVSGGIGGILMAGGWDPLVVSFYRSAVGLLFVVGWLVLRPVHTGLKNPRLWLWSVAAGLGVAGNFAFYFVSISHGSVAVSATLMYCAPVFVYLISIVFKLETLTASKSLAMVLVMVGIILLTGVYDIGASGVSAVSVGAGLLSGLSYALFIFAFKYASKYGSARAVLSIVFLLSCFILIAVADGYQLQVALVAPDWALFVGLGVLGAGLSFVLYIIGLRQTAPAVASIVAMVEPVTASLFGVSLLGQGLSMVQLGGMALILLAVTGMGVVSGSGESVSYPARS